MRDTPVSKQKEQQQEEIRRGREEQRRANQVRREQMRKEAEQVHDQKSSQTLRDPESSSSGSDQHRSEVQQV
ncbi:hypothetical protein AOQ84DRAFT_387994 [Glonium stellatum]|uniref:Uncharacterized protein n=1 Tax=Glonium stellatum TaxID=574774 RepID=A0A8E2F340_9PEZI|nr:hypothetical protein AOQ84DRAFT_387994 [Glonium stellatum]